MLIKVLCKVTTMSGVIGKITVDIKTPEATWKREMLLFYDREKYEEALKLIEEELGFRSDYVVHNNSFHPLADDDAKYAICHVTFRKLEKLADDIEYEGDP